MSIMAKTPSGYKKIGSAYLGEQPVDKVFNANGDVVYALQRELTGVPPLLFKGKEQSDLLNYRICGNTETKQRDYSGSSPLTAPVHDGELYNYRIYGNTVNGESVGDRTGNLFDKTIFDKNVANNALIYVPIYVGDMDYVTCSTTCPKTITGTGDNDNFNSRYIFILSGNVNTGAANDVNGVSNGTPRTIQPSNGYVTIAYRKIESYNVRPWEYQIMLNEGSTAIPYEPYGYKVPVTISNGTDTLTTPIYLPEPIKMVGSEAEYVDFYSQKQYFADGTNTAVTIPALPISAGTNTVTVNTTVQPSNVEVSTDENVSVGDLVTSGQHAGEYKVSVTVSNGTDTLTTPIYLPEPIKMVGSEAEYVDYAEQKMHRIGADDLDVTLPALPTIKGTNTMSVDTEVQPSRMDIKGRIKTLT